MSVRIIYSRSIADQAPSGGHIKFFCTELDHKDFSSGRQSSIGGR